MDPSKIKAIKKYLSQQGVEYYDVQAELIDHFATAIEKMEREQPNLPFKRALLKAHQSFGGRKGFQKYVARANKTVQQKTNRLVWQTFLQFLHWPYMFATAAIAAFWYYALPTLNVELNLLLLAFLVCFTFLGLFNYFRFKRIPWYLPKRANKALGWIFYFAFYLPFYVGFFDIINSWNPVATIAILTILTLGLYAFYTVPKKLLAQTLKMYPQIR